MNRQNAPKIQRIACKLVMLRKRFSMSDVQVASDPTKLMHDQLAPAPDEVLEQVMRVLLGIRPRQSNGQAYHETSNLTDAGFTSVEMVRVMLGVEAAFDIMIPQDMITPENFANAMAISVMIARLV
jgi:acyl carrier protein